MSTTPTRESLHARVVQQRQNILDYFKDVEYQNAQLVARGELPIDPDPDGVMASCLKSLEATLLMELAEARRLDKPPAGTFIPEKRLTHKAGLVNAYGEISAVCFETPAKINLKTESWTPRDEAVTCPKCLALIEAALR